MPERLTKKIEVEENGSKIQAHEGHMREFKFREIRITKGLVDKFGYSAVDIPVADTPRDAHMANFIECTRTRAKPNLDAETGYRAQVVISMGVQSFREGKVLFFDPKKEEVVYDAPKLA